MLQIRIILFFVLISGRLFSQTGTIKMIKPADKVRSMDTINNQYAIAALKNNYLYIGIENPLSISVETIPSQNLMIKTSNGIIKGKNGSYTIEPSPGNLAEISIYTLCKNDTCFVGAENFRLKQLPDPELFPAWNKGKYLVSKGELIAGGGIVPALEDFVYDIQFRIKSFEMKTVKNNSEIILKSSGPAYTTEMKNLISETPSGTEISFQNIIVIYPDKTEKKFDKPIVVKLL